MTDMNTTLCLHTEGTVTVPTELTNAQHDAGRRAFTVTYRHSDTDEALVTVAGIYWR